MEDKVHCITCGKDRTKRNLEIWECAHFECPLRKPDVQIPPTWASRFDGNFAVRPTTTESQE